MGVSRQRRRGNSLTQVMEEVSSPDSAAKRERDLTTGIWSNVTLNNNNKDNDTNIV